MNVLASKIVYEIKVMKWAYEEKIRIQKKLFIQNKNIVIAPIARKLFSLTIDYSKKTFIVVNIMNVACKKIPVTST